MDASVAAALGVGLDSFVDSATNQLVANLPLAIGIAVSVAVVFFGIRTFRAIAHV